MAELERRAGRLGTPRRRGVGVDLVDVGRWTTGAVGGSLAVWGVRRGRPLGIAAALVGSGLMVRALAAGTGLTRALRIRRGERSPASVVEHGRGVTFRRAITIQRPREEVWNAFRDTGRMALWMDGIERVEPISEKLSHWTARGPAGTEVRWDAEIHEERPGERLVWRSLDGSDVVHVGSATLEDAPGDRGTEVLVSMAWEPWAGKLGDLLAKAIGASPEQRLRESLRRFKSLLETGVCATTAGQPSGREREARPEPPRAALPGRAAEASR